MDSDPYHPITQSLSPSPKKKVLAGLPTRHRELKVEEFQKKDVTRNLSTSRERLVHEGNSMKSILNYDAFNEKLPGARAGL